MSVTFDPMVDRTPQELAWAEAEEATVALMGTLNGAAAGMVKVTRHLLDTGAWAGVGIRTPEHWLMWKAAMPQGRARRIVRIARRLHELPQCFALFEAGRLGEEAMELIARHVGPSRDAEVARWAPGMLYSQLRRVLVTCPEQPDGKPKPVRGRERDFHHHRVSDDGWVKGTFQLPPDEATRLQAALDLARDAEYRERQGLEPDASLDDESLSARRSVSLVDAFLRLVDAGSDRLDRQGLRTGHPGERTKVVLHVDVEPDGTFGPTLLHGGGVIPDAVARYMRCDAQVMVAAYKAGQLIGINPSDRTVSWPVRRAIEHRDQGCVHPLCTQRRWVHIHHIHFWEDGGRTAPENLCSLCPTHHRALHAGEFSIEGDPEAGTLRFLDEWGRPIEPPGTGLPRLPEPGEASAYRPPYGERLNARDFFWN